MKMSKQADFRKQLADEFISILETPQVNWKKPWFSPDPINATTGREYNGINRFKLFLESAKKGYTDCRWCTFNQIREKGWHLKKGSKGVQIEFWMPFHITKKKFVTWQEYNHPESNPLDYSLKSRYYIVFNAENIEGIPPLDIKENKINIHEFVQHLSQSMDVPIYNDGGSRAFYQLDEDAIHLPKAEYFSTDLEYNATILHELAHATGASHRLNRNQSAYKNSEKYAYEELVAEITSCFMSRHMVEDISELNLQNHKSYVQSWCQHLKNKPELLISAIKEAETASAYMEQLVYLSIEQTAQADENMFSAYNNIDDELEF